MKKKLILAAAALAAIFIPYTVEGDNKTGSLHIKAVGYSISRDSADGDTILSVPGVAFTLRKKGLGRKKSTPLFNRALLLAAQKGHISSEYLCRKMSVGASCADAFIEMMQEYGVIGKPSEDGVCDVIMSKDEIEQLSRSF